MRDSRTRVAKALHALGWILFAGVPASLFAPGCQGRECESDGFHDYGYAPGEGDLANPDTWESTPNDATWLAFGPYRTWIFHPTYLNGRTIVSVTPYISADPNPNSPGQSFTIASGNSAVIGISKDNGSVFVTNSTCAPVYIRMVIVAAPAEPAPDLGDGGFTDDSGTDLDAGDGGDG